MAENFDNSKQNPSKQDESLSQVLGEEIFVAYKDYVEGHKEFGQIDNDQNGFLSQTELDSYAKRNPQSQVAARLSHNFYKVMSASNDEWGLENDGITDNDLKARYIETVRVDDLSIRKRVFDIASSEKTITPRDEDSYPHYDHLLSVKDKESGVTYTQSLNRSREEIRLNIKDSTRNVELDLHCPYNENHDRLFKLELTPLPELK
ncbi:MAG: hypothetical protein K2W82_06675 [Candidatus Obscuribacterales bacterium]|jgi:hypothetical protein|nr:hypothetical protein [Candidatus Obscuribacterales bacterium]